MTSALFARSAGILSEELMEKSVLVVGLGSGGSYVTESLARSGIGRFVLVDGENVEAENICRTTYYTGDIGCTKVSALTRHLQNINPTVEIMPCETDLAGVGHERLGAVINSVDLIIALTDDPYAQSRLNHYAYYCNKPALFAALYRGAEGGEIIICIPGKTPCMECATGGVREALSRPDADVDYGTGRLSAEPAIIADIHHLDSATVKLALSLLQQNRPELSVSKFLASALAQKLSYLCMSMVPDYWVFPEVFRNTPGQHGYQSMWFTVESRDECPFCSSTAEREDPSKFPLALPKIVMKETINRSAFSA
ncbi:MAG: ThiF family adenylyltransferase [Chlorobiaceae bacterium]